AGLYALGRRLGLSRGAAFTAGGTWIASGPFLSLGNLWNHLAGAAWIPWVLLGAVAAIETGRVGCAMLCGAAAAAQVTTGSPDLVALTASLAAVPFALRAWRPSVGADRRRVLAAAAIALAFGVALAAGQILPSLELGRRAGRFAMGEA